MYLFSGLATLTLAMTHFYPLSALCATSPEGGSEVCLTVFARERSDRGKLPGGWTFTKHIYRSLFKFKTVAGEIVQVRRGGAIVFGLPVNLFGRVSYYKFALCPR